MARRGLLGVRARVSRLSGRVAWRGRGVIGRQGAAGRQGVIGDRAGYVRDWGGAAVARAKQAAYLGWVGSGSVGFARSQHGRRRRASARVCGRKTREGVGGVGVGRRRAILNPPLGSTNIISLSPPRDFILTCGKLAS